MKKNIKFTTEEQIIEFYQQLNHPLTNVVEALRKIILTTDKEIGEQIKWNSPSFYYTGQMEAFDPKEYKRDIVVFNLHKSDAVLLVFPTGAIINDHTGILEGNFKDLRKTIKIASLEEAISKEVAIKTVLSEWLKLVVKWNLFCFF